MSTIDTTTLTMTAKQRVHATLEGRPVDRAPVTSLYNQLYILDHYAELTGQESWQQHAWLIAPPDEHLVIYRTIIEAAPFDLLQPQLAAPCADRESVEIVMRDGKPARHDKRADRYTPLHTVSGHATDYHANETRRVFDRQDVNDQVKLRRAEQMIAEGVNDYAEATVKALGRDHFILTGGVVGTLYACHEYIGLANLFEMLLFEPELVEYLSAKMLEQNIEYIRSHAAAGGDAIYIDDATATSDMISVRHYERFCLPYLKPMVDEIHRLSHKAILIYFGGIADRLDQIASLGADGLSMETSMKGYTNDIEEIARRIGRRVSLFGNIDPVGVLQSAPDRELEAEMRRQARARDHARGFIHCTGSPITPFTPLSRVRRFIELGRQI